MMIDPSVMRRRPRPQRGLIARRVALALALFAVLGVVAAARETPADGPVVRTQASADGTAPVWSDKVVVLSPSVGG